MYYICFRIQFLLHILFLSDSAFLIPQFSLYVLSPFTVYCVCSIGRHKIAFPQYIHTECSYRMHSGEVKCRNREIGCGTEETGKQTSRQEIVV